MPDMPEVLKSARGALNRTANTFVSESSPLGMKESDGVLNDSVVDQNNSKVQTDQSPKRKIKIKKKDADRYKSPKIKKENVKEYVEHIQEDDTLFDDFEQEDAFSYADIQQKFFDIVDSEAVEDVTDLNEKFLAQQLGGVDAEDLAMLPKIELRVDTRFHNLQVTGEILTCLESLKLNDSIIQSFTDLGTSFRNIRFLHIARCEL